MESTELIRAKALELCFTAKFVAGDPPKEIPIRPISRFWAERINGAFFFLQYWVENDIMMMWRNCIEQFILVDRKMVMMS